MWSLELSPKIRAAVVALVFCLVMGMIAVSIFVAIYESRLLPERPHIKYDTNQEDLQKQIKTYKEVSEVIRANVQNMFDVLVTRTFLPIFQALIASVLTFIFGQVLISLLHEYLKRKYPHSE